MVNPDGLDNVVLTLVDPRSRQVMTTCLQMSEFKQLMQRGLNTWVEPPPALLLLSDKLDLI